MKPAVFLDRDGVINENRADYVKSWHEVVFLPGVFDALRSLAATPFAVVVVTNQSAINRGIVPAHAIEEIHQRLAAEVRRRQGRIDAVFCCPHRPDEGCTCRKPRPGLLLQAARQLNLDLANSFFIGDAVTDVEAALAVGVQPILVLTGRGQQQLPLLQDRGVDGVWIARDLQEAVDRILQHISSRNDLSLDGAP